MTAKRIDGARFDTVGLAASSLCLVHCIGTAALGFLLPALGLTFLADERIHHALAVIVVAAGLLAFVPGFRLHQSWPIAIFAALGMGAIALSQFWPVEDLRERCETALTIFGGGMLVIAHWQNRIMCRANAVAVIAADKNEFFPHNAAANRAGKHGADLVMACPSSSILLEAFWWAITAPAKSNLPPKATPRGPASGRTGGKCG